MKIRSKRIWIGDCFIPGILEITAGKISRILPYHDFIPDEDFGSRRIVPGFIDIHTHGAYGFDTNSGDPEGLKNWKRRLPSEGVTTFLATTVTAPKEQILRGIRNVVSVRKERTEGADLLGIHLEGPFIDQRYHGAQPLEAVARPSVDTFRNYQEAAEGLIKVVTIAPEHDADFALIRYCSSTGVVASLGHSAATREQAAMAMANGAQSVTHTFNGMSGFSHRENGMVGAAMRYDGLYSEIICDCNHSSPEALNLLFRAKGKEKPIMISDSVMPKGSPVGSVSSFSGLEVEIYPDGSAHLVSDGTFAGSTLKINEGLYNLVERALVPFDMALNACTANPARLLGMSDRIGSLTAGHDADVVVLNDDYTVNAAFCKGTKQCLE